MRAIITPETGITRLAHLFGCLEAQTYVPNKSLTLLLDDALAVLKYRGLLLVCLFRLKETMETVTTELLNKATYLLRHFDPC